MSYIDRTYRNWTRSSLHTHRIFNTKEEADKVAKILNKDDDNWKYRVIPDPKGSGRCIIKVYDEDGLFLGNL